MRNLSDTITHLAALRGALGEGAAGAGIDRLTDLPDFGSNPGALRARIHIPEGLPERAALVVVLHGCGQDAAGYDHGSGWSRLADRHGFAVLFPEQQRQNNPNLCFNWFVPEHSRRGGGEALSIHQMIATLTGALGIDRTRIYVTGLSAGGAMASVMLATYPELFAGGAIIAGLPYGSATNMAEAFDRMRGHGAPGEAELAALVRRASDHGGPWPTISVWHGSADTTVSPSNAQDIVGQWRALHGVGAEPSRIEAIDGYPRRAWCDPEGREVIEEFSITGMGHGTPLDTLGDEGCGASGAYMIEASISSTRHICRFWGLSEGEGARVERQEPRFEDPRFEDPRLEDPRLEDPRLEDPRLEDPRLEDPRLEDPRLEDPRLEDLRLEDPCLEDPRLEDLRLEDPRPDPAPSTTEPVLIAEPAEAIRPRVWPKPTRLPSRIAASGVGKLIEDALRAAGLMR